MDKKLKFLLLAGSIIIIIVVIAINALIRQYEKESLPAIPQGKEGSVPREEEPDTRQEEMQEFTQDDIEIEPPIQEGALLN